ncbi:hypothetical protein ACFXJ5_09215 [Streptomyces sp. NPDC059373]
MTTAQQVAAYINDRAIKVREILGLTAVFIAGWLDLFAVSQQGWWKVASGLGAVGALAAAVLITRPLFDSLNRKWQRRLSSLTLLLYGALISAFLVAATNSLFFEDNRGGAASLLIGIWVIHSLVGGSFEPEDFPLERLRSRIGRAAALRVFANWCGTMGFIWLIQYNSSDKKLDGPLFNMTLTLLVTITVTSLKTLTRVRKFCTQLHSDAQSLIRALEEIRDADGLQEQKHKRAAALRTWDALHRTVVNRVDTGFYRYGTFVLPKDAIADLEEKVSAAINAVPDMDTAHRLLTDDLRVIQKACEGRLDSVA